MKNLLIKIAATAVISLGLVAQASAVEVKTYDDPYKMIEAVADQTFRRISNDQPVIEKNIEHLRVIVNEELVPYIDSRYAAFRVIGNYIKQTKPEDRDAFVVAFKDYMVATYAGALTQYKNQKVIFEPARAVGSQNIVTIKTRVIDPGKPDINIEFKLRRAKDSQNWQVFDMVAEGISLLDSKRAELGNLIRQQGLASVTALLVEKSKAPITAPMQGNNAKN
ncbi:MAG: toluene tolerance protein [Chromatiales bacterium RIFOXYA1_FULL_46_5]|nr:MAG: toluene tolerance protein [Chromatiales bacterium RIFOXYA1_FULL_46_5]